MVIIRAQRERTTPVHTILARWKPIASFLYIFLSWSNLLILTIEPFRIVIIEPSRVFRWVGSCPIGWGANILTWWGAFPTSWVRRSLSWDPKSFQPSIFTLTCIAITKAWTHAWCWDPGTLSAGITGR